MWPFGNRRKAIFRFDSACTSACGPVRPENQDSFLLLPDKGVFCVADGMGGGQGGALASRWTCAAVQDYFSSAANVDEPDLLQAGLALAVQRVNDRVLDHVDKMGWKAMGSTIALLWLDPMTGEGFTFHAGDSRIYRARDGMARRLTHDHTVGNELGSMGGAGAAALKSRRNPLSHVLTRAVGTQIKVRPEVHALDCRAKDRYLVCSDGVHDMLSDIEIASALVGGSSPEEVMRELQLAVLKAGANDNFTIVVADVAAC